MKPWAELPEDADIVSPISRHHRRAPPLSPTHIVIPHTCACPSLTNYLGTHPEVGPRKIHVSQLDKSPSSWSRDTCLGHDGVSSRLHSRPRGAAFRLCEPSVARGYHLGQRDVASILLFSFGLLTLPGARLALKCLSGCRLCASRPWRTRSPGSAVVSFRVKRHDILLLSSFFIRTRPVFARASSVPPAIFTLHGTSLQKHRTNNKDVTHVGMLGIRCRT